MTNLELKQTSFHSMTGYGRGSASSSRISVSVEIKSLNGRYLEFRPKFPRAFSFWESEVKKIVSSFVKRGSVEVYLSYQIIDPDMIKYANDSVVTSYCRTIEKIAKDLGISANYDLSNVLRLPGALSQDGLSMLPEKEINEITDLMDQALRSALAGLIEMRCDEGKEITSFLQREIDSSVKFIEVVRGLLPNARAGLREKIQKRINESLKDLDIEIDENRLVQEVAFYSDKSDFTEEVDRLDSHIKQFSEILREKSELVIGKRLDFLVQEMLRESNTLGAKTDDLQITNQVLNLKSSIDRIREQVQNLE